MRAEKAMALAISLVVAGGVLAFSKSPLMGPLAHAADTVLTSWLKVGPLKIVEGVSDAYYAIAALLSSWVCMQLPRPSRRLGFLFGLVFLTFLLCLVLGIRGVLFEPFTGVFAVLMSGMATMALVNSRKLRVQNELRDFFAGRLSKAGFRKLLRSGDGSQLTGKRRVTALTCQMLNHSALSVEMEAEELEEFSSGFLQVVAEFLVARGGYLDECDVRRVRVLFGFPNQDENHAVAAARAALELKQRAANLAAELENRWHKKARIGVSLSSGEVATGLFGFQGFEFFSAVGEALDFGDHLCALNAEYGSEVLVSSETVAASLDGLEVRPMELVSRGNRRNAEVYELLALKHGLTEKEAAAREAFRQGVVHLRKGDPAAARKMFERAAIDGVKDAPLAYFMDKAVQSAPARAEEKDKKGRGRKPGA